MKSIEPVRTQLTGAFRTLGGDEVDPDDPSLVDRGAQYWSAVELIGPAWYVIVGTRIDEGDEQRRYFLTTIDTALTVIGHARLVRTRVFACIATPGALHGEEAIGEVAEILISADHRRHVVRFKTGIDLLIAGDDCGRADNIDCTWASAFRSATRPTVLHS